MGITSTFETEVREAVPGLEKRETWGTRKVKVPTLRLCGLGFTFGMGCPRF
jgi:hypothetical protein